MPGPDASRDTLSPSDEPPRGIREQKPIRLGGDKGEVMGIKVG